MSREAIIAALNHHLRAELSAVEIYAAHARAIAEPAIAQGVQAILLVEERHARDLAARIRALGGEPVEPGGPETVAGRAAAAATQRATTVGMLRLELAEEQQAIKDYAAHLADLMLDEETHDLLEQNLADELQHARWLKAQIAALGK
ncbi:MAG TPA: DUF2383 domain-containing protein [Chloroflexi bacterium]|nr:DUF2383 domain-containing protein [Chloroflexota bacterium]